MDFVNNIFYNLSNIGTEEYNNINKEISNKNYSNYNLENYSDYNNYFKANNIATNQQCIFINGSTTGGIDSNYIDYNSKLLMNKTSRVKNEDSISNRIFKTVPYLGKGPYDVNNENKLNNYQLNSNRKTHNSNTEITNDEYTYYPLIPSIESTITNPSNLVEGVASSDWIRGGIPSRLLNRDQGNN